MSAGNELQRSDAATGNMRRPTVGVAAEFCDERVCLSVVFVCPRVYLQNYMSHKIFLRILLMAVAQYSSGGIAIRYVLPVLWITSYLHVVGHVRYIIDTVAASDIIASSCGGCCAAAAS